MNKNRHPVIGQKLLNLILPANERKYLIEGFEDLFGINLKDKGRLLTLLWYWKEVLVTVVVISIDNLIGSVAMLKNYLLIAIRTNLKNKMYSFINVSGLAIGMACVNYMNLSTARSASRAKEIGLRKVVGAVRRNVIFQFMGESIMLSFIALFLAVGLVIILLPAFNSIFNQNLPLNLLANFYVIPVLTRSI